MSALLEIACFSPFGAMIAANSDCDRLELCSDYSVGGLTPSHGYLELIRRKTDKPLFVMIRNAGGFTSWSMTDQEAMFADVEFCKQAGMNGIVAGLLTKDSKVDTGFMHLLAEKAFPLPVTFHRAFDECTDPFEAMEALIDCGVKRILTSGGKKNAEEGIPLLKQLNEKAAGRIIVVPGGGVTIMNAARIIAATGCTEIHSSAKGGKHGADYDDIIPDPDMIRELKKLTG